MQTELYKIMADLPVRPAEPGSATQAEPIPTTNPHAQVTKMAFAWSKDQTPSNYTYHIHTHHYLFGATKRVLV